MSVAMVVDTTVHIDYRTQASQESIEQVVEAIRVAVAAHWPRTDDTSMHALSSDQRSELVARLWEDLTAPDKALETGNAYAYFQVRLPLDQAVIFCVWLSREIHGDLGVILGFVVEQTRRIRCTDSDEGVAPNAVH
jgi:hypothetical protein